MSKLNLPVGVSNFKKLRESDFYFVDKTLFIRDVITNSSEVLLITRPRRFGKTINLSMLHCFLTNRPDEINPELFQGTNITKDKSFCEAYQNQHPVIFITFKGVKEESFANAESAIRGIIGRLFNDWESTLIPSLNSDEKALYSALKNKSSDWDDLKYSLKHLCGFITRAFGKSPYLFIDEYDTPITAAYINNTDENQYYKKMVGLMRGILGEGLKDNSLLAKGVVTGITKVSQESIFSGFNNPDVYNFLREDYGQYFGFTEAEVVKLLNDDDNVSKHEEIKTWYNGYQVGKYTLYNPWSILNCMKQNYQFEAYWMNTSDNALIKEQLTKSRDAIKETFIKLIQGERVEEPIAENIIFPELKDSEEAIWSLLHSSGYLNVHGTRLVDWGKLAVLSIPNREVKFVYDSIITSFFRKTLKTKTYYQFSQSLAEGDIETFKAILSTYLMQSGSFFDFNKNSSEQIFHTFMLGLVVGLRDEYVITSNLESGFGRYDLALVPKDSEKQGLLLEFKLADSSDNLKNKAQEALNQIKDKKYTTAFYQQNIKTILLIGLSFCGKDVEAASETVSQD